MVGATFFGISYLQCHREITTRKRLHVSRRQEPSEIAVGDSNHDGSPDIAVANSADDNVGVTLELAPMAHLSDSELALSVRRRFMCASGAA